MFILSASHNPAPLASERCVPIVWGASSALFYTLKCAKVGLAKLAKLAPYRECLGGNALGFAPIPYAEAFPIKASDNPDRPCCRWTNLCFRGGFPRGVRRRLSASRVISCT